jgi:hypothetical protein
MTERNSAPPPSKSNKRSTQTPPNLENPPQRPTTNEEDSIPPPPMPPPPRRRLLPTRPFRPNLNPREPPRLKLDRNFDNTRRMIPRPKLNSNRERRRRERVWEVDVSVPGSGVGVGRGVGVEARCRSCGACAWVGRVFGGGHCLGKFRWVCVLLSEGLFVSVFGFWVVPLVREEEGRKTES